MSNNNAKTKDNGVYVSRQIAVYKTDKKLLELNDNLNPAPITAYAHLHAQADRISEDRNYMSETQYENGRRIYSTIRLVLQDYSNGTGDNTVRVMSNISPDETQYIYSRVFSGAEKFEFISEKIYGQKDENGYSTMTKLKIIRSTVGSDGKPRNYPWYIECVRP